MKTNTSSNDRTIRTMAAAMLTVLVFTGTLTGVLAVTAGMVATIFLLTIIVGLCPLYLPWRISPKKQIKTT